MGRSLPADWFSDVAYRTACYPIIISSCNGAQPIACRLLIVYTNSDSVLANDATGYWMYNVSLYKVADCTVLVSSL